MSIPKSLAVLVGMESYMGTKRKVKDAEARLVREKDKIVHPAKLRAQEEQRKDKSQSAEKEREYLERSDRRRRESMQVPGR